MIKKIMNVLVCVSMLGLTACGGLASAQGGKGSSGNDKFSVVCTTFSCYDWTKEIMGDHVEEANLTYLLENGTDMHSFQPSAADIAEISACDVFVYVGGESEEWADDALKNATNKDMKVIKLMDVEGINTKEEEIKEGMQGEEEEEEEHSEAPEYDEHIWLSPKNAQILCKDIAEALCDADPDNADDYKANLSTYEEKLSELDSKFEDVVSNAKVKTLVFGDRFPFRYLCDDYGLDYYAAFVGCSAETEASFETVAFLAKKTEELGVDTVFTIENSDGKIAQAIISSTKSKDQKTAVLDSIQSVSKEKIENGTTYISLMEQNVETLKTAIN
ncbi:metal ABC transporter substrate-binding protein [Ruminococcus albus]|uniref:Zinc transport system substrate-binding protein n=1 Tax=Ruminococcus albus TaxID=1264 RepID=A0A1I1R2S2_RUMAL|nr:metal ABC transporter substrate-binding protein [Ruminococcus albus]SFD28666.1 zinc transport system substrate-binding protein [Ruminococcus albus]